MHVVHQVVGDRREPEAAVSKANSPLLAAYLFKGGAQQYTPPRETAKEKTAPEPDPSKTIHQPTQPDYSS